MMKNIVILLVGLGFVFTLALNVHAKEKIKGDALFALVNGKTLTGINRNGKAMVKTYNRDGTYVYEGERKKIQGTWRINEQGQICQKMTTRERCYDTYKEGDEYVSYMERNGEYEKWTTWTVE